MIAYFFFEDFLPPAFFAAFFFAAISAHHLSCLYGTSRSRFLALHRRIAPANLQTELE
ncbi:MAG TPA: hypothetical protein VNA69_06890 [Thermoanaerobaculia bacterium]|nr:hypothetical protein [Thermoanaerobaculia bacterium]